MNGTQIALDVMGGDEAPETILRGARTACSALGSLRIAPERILLVGDSARIESYLAANGGNPGFDIRHASQAVEMGEAPAAALRHKPDSSIAGCVAAIREGGAAAMISMGNTGACVGAATLGLGTLQGVRRPGIAVTLQLSGEPVTLLDMGANVAPKAEHLCQYGAMGAVYMRDCLGVREPRVGLLNVGEEKGKGTELLKAAFPLMEQAPFRFVGNVEGSDIFSGVCDLVVTDGFTGNVILKLMEHFSEFLLGLVLERIAGSGSGCGEEALSSVRQSIDYSTYGGALLLGVSGIVVIGHGRSDEMAVANALGLACRAVDAHVNSHIEQGLAAGV